MAPHATTSPSPASTGPSTGAPDTVGEVARATLERRATALAAEIARTGREWTVESIHDLRVATRRLRSALRLFGPVLTPEPTRDLDRGLRRFMRRFNALRDLDVQLEAWPRLTRRAPGHLREALDRLRDRLRHRKADLDRRLRTTPGDLGPITIPAPDTSAEARALAAQPFVTSAHALLAGELAEAGRRAAIIPWHDPVAAVEPLHALRIQIKRLRYGVEPFSPLLGPDGDHLLRWLKKLQDELGHLHDLDVLAVDLLAQLTAIEAARHEQARRLVADIRWPTLPPHLAERFDREESRLDRQATLLVLDRVARQRRLALTAVRKRLAQAVARDWQRTLAGWFATGTCPVHWQHDRADD